MNSISSTEHIAPTSRVYTAILGAALTALALVGGLIASFMVGSITSGALEARVPNQYVIPLTAIMSSLVMLSGSALWGVGMARLARVAASWRVAIAAILGFVPVTILVAFGLAATEPFVFGRNLPVHRLFTLLFVPSVGLIAGTSGLALGWALRWGRAAPARALKAGLTAALAFLAVDLGMEALGWQVGGPGAAERSTMLTVLFAGNLVAALAGGAALSTTLNQQH